jgi:group II intron reverse transcriptase/maturase
MLLIEAHKYLEVVRKRGMEGSELRRVYYNIATNQELFLNAYANLYANDGAMTPGVESTDTVDGMSLERIDTIMTQLKERTYTWTPVRRTYIGKRNSQETRPLGMPGFNDKLLQEVIRMVLEAYYEPQFRKSSHGFRPSRGCHTALDRVATWKGTRWFIEGDIRGCFDNLDHNVIVHALRKRIKDHALLTLIKGMLHAGYVENWQYHRTYSGTPQGGIASPILANIVLNELDAYIEDEIIPHHTRGKVRKFNPEYTKLAGQERRARKKGNVKGAKKIRKMYTKIPSRLPHDPEYRRIWYVRYADDFLIGYIGTKHEAEDIKDKVGTFLETIRLEMSEEKTLITHARTGKARFLGYEINLIKADDKVTAVKKHAVAGVHKRRTLNQQIFFAIPQDVVNDWTAKVEKGNSIIRRSELLNLSVYDIISTYETELQGLINYYCRAHNQAQLKLLRYKWQESLIHTLADKFRMGLAKTRRKYARFSNAGQEKLIGIEIPRDDQKPLRTIFGRKPVQRQKGTPMVDDIQNVYVNRNGVIDRLMAATCEICGKEGVPVEGHHITKLKNLKKQWRGKEKPGWVKRMIAIRRKSLFVCKKCHQEIHAGKYDGKRLAQI